MVNVLVVDDEMMIRRGIIHKIRRLTDFCTQIEEARNGEEAFCKIEEHKPDIVITDIKMPNMNGLLLIEKAQEIHPMIKFIIISGYDSFAYARKAVKLGVFDYLLKPIDNGELKQCLESLHKKIEEEKKNYRMFQAYKESMETDQNYRKNHLLQHFLETEGKGTKEFLERLRTIGKQVDKTYYTGIALTIVDIGKRLPVLKEEDLADFIVSNILEECMGEKAVCVSFYGGQKKSRIGGLVNHDYEGCRLERELYAFSEKIEELLEIRLGIAFGNTYDRLEEFPKSYRQACLHLKQYMVLDQKRVITPKDYCQIKENDYTICEETRRILLHCLLFITSEKERLKQLADNMLQEMYEKKICYANIKTAYLDLMILVLNDVKNRNNGRLRQVYDFDVEAVFENSNSIGELRSHFFRLVDSIAKIMKDEELDGGKRIVQEMERRIETEYFHDLKLSSLAGEYYMNQSYLSALFLQETGQNFSKYLTEVRIVKAKELLETSQFSTGRIAEFVGYKDRSYFISVFRKKTGMSPTEYRKTLSDSSGK